MSTKARLSVRYPTNQRRLNLHVLGEKLEANKGGDAYTRRRPRRIIYCTHVSRSRIYPAHRPAAA